MSRETAHAVLIAWQPKFVLASDHPLRFQKINEVFNIYKKASYHKPCSEHT